MRTGVGPSLAETPTRELIRIARDEPMAAEALVPSIPPALGNALRKCLEKEPGDRYQHASDLAVDLRHLERDLKTVTRTGPSPITTSATVALATWPTTPPRIAA